MRTNTNILALAAAFILTAACGANDLATDEDKPDFPAPEGCIGSACDQGEKDPGKDPGETEPTPTPVASGATLTLSDTCRQIGFDTETGILSVTMQTGETFSAPLEWSHPTATIEYISAPNLLPSILVGGDCAPGDALSISARVGGNTASHQYAACGGDLGNLVHHMNTLADDYFQDARCY